MCVKVSLPVHFSNNSVLDFQFDVRDPTSGRTTTEGFHSISFVMRKTEPGDCIIAQLLEDWRLQVPNSHELRLLFSPYRITLIALI